MNIKVIKTRKFLPPKDDLFALIKEGIFSLSEGSVVAVTSKIVSIGEGRCLPIQSVKDKDGLIMEESDQYILRDKSPFRKLHTLKNGILVGASGIDESNANEHYILWPKDPDRSAKEIWKFMRKEYKVNNLGIIITDSYVVPMKRGIVGRAISYYGIEPLKDYRGKEDIFGRKMKFSQLNNVDSIAAFAVFLMGEGNEKTPIVVFKNLPGIHFAQRLLPSEKKYTSWKVPIDEDLFGLFLTSVSWKKGGKV